MWRVLPAHAAGALLAAFVLLVPTSDGVARGRGPRIVPGARINGETQGGVRYSVVVPKKWRPKRALPLVITVPRSYKTETEGSGHHFGQGYLEQNGGTKGGAFYCAVLLQSHNKEGRRAVTQFDSNRFLMLLERDTQAVKAVIEEVRERFPIQRGAVAIQGSWYSSEVAMGIALRLREDFAALFLMNVWNNVKPPSTGTEWFLLPKGEKREAALDLPIILTYQPDEANLDKREREHIEFRDALKRLGLRNTELVMVDRKVKYPHNLVIPAWHRLVDFLKAGAQRGVRLDERDRLLTAAHREKQRSNLPKALDYYRKTSKYEAKHELDAASAKLYADLVAEGREVLEEADALPPEKHKVRVATYRKVVRWFKDTPFGEKVATDLKAISEQ